MRPSSLPFWGYKLRVNCFYDVNKTWKNKEKSKKKEWENQKEINVVLLFVDKHLSALKCEQEGIPLESSKFIIHFFDDSPGYDKIYKKKTPSENKLIDAQHNLKNMF